MNEQEKKQARELAIRGRINHLENQRQKLTDEITYLQGWLNPPKPKAKPAPKKKAMAKTVKKGPSEADIAKAAKTLKKELESPQFAAALKQGVGERDAISVDPVKGNSGQVA